MKISSKLCILATGLFTATVALAGAKFGTRVVIATDWRYAHGDLGYVRNTTDSNVEYISCYLQATKGSSYYATCDARDLNGVYRSCSTEDPGHLAVIASLTPDSQVFFTWDDQGYCQYVSVNTASYLEPKR